MKTSCSLTTRAFAILLALTAPILFLVIPVEGQDRLLGDNFVETPRNYHLIFVYAIKNDGEMLWYRRDSGESAWQGPKKVGNGWNFKDVIPAGGNSFYALTAEGKLMWYRHDGFRDGSAGNWAARVEVGRGWNFTKIFSGGEGIIYAITQDGTLRWYKHNGYQTGAGLETPGAWENAKDVGRGWGGFEHVFSVGRGIIYAITQDGKLRWYKHNGYLTGAGLEAPGSWEGPKEVGHGWSGFRQIVPAGRGVILVIQNDGKLRWYKHNGYMAGTGLETPGAWEGPKEVGTSWHGFKQVIALLPVSLERRRRGIPDQSTTDGPGIGVASREIRCRGFSKPGGGNFVFFTIDSRPNSTGETLVTYEIAFRPSWRAAGLRGEGLDPGECAFADRPIAASGPYRIRFETVANAQLKQTLHGSTVDRSSTAAESYPDVNTIPVYLKGDNHYWSFGGITDSGKGYFVATGNGFWKPAIALESVPASPTEPARHNDTRRSPTEPARRRP